MNLKLMADYDCYLLWSSRNDGSVNHDPAELPITVELAKGLSDWAARYDATLDRDNPIASGFQSEAE